MPTPVKITFGREVFSIQYYSSEMEALLSQLLTEQNKIADNMAQIAEHNLAIDGLKRQIMIRQVLDNGNMGE
jgi:hypothetical protein